MGGSTKSTTTQTNSPPAWAADMFKQSGRVGGELYNSGQGGNTYHGNTVSDLSGTTVGGVNQLINAGNSWDTSGSRPLYQGIGAASVGDSNADKYLTDTANGSYLADGNPYYRQRLDTDIQHANDLIRSGASGSGRYGDNYFNTKAVGDSTTNMLLSGLESDWNRERQNQITATGMLDQQRNTGLDRAMGAVQGITGLDQQNFQNRLQGAGATLQAGGILDQQSQKQLSDAINEWYATDNEDWNRLGMLQGAAAGAAGPYGTQVANSRQSSTPGIGQILGGVGGLMGK